ncbi:MAG: GNAT family N-acetyltransferase [Fidelibacterota bacterium]|nr:MAG: GNAT family N-acetyltransferase [Candidatus Neomarinimicrobiota bacterium]
MIDPLDDNLQSRLPLFHQKWWLDVVATDAWHYLVERKNAMTMIWPIYILRRFFLNLCKMPPLTMFLGPVFFPKDCDQDIQVEALRSKLLRAGIARIRPYLRKRIHVAPGFNDLVVFKQAGYRIDKRITHRIDGDLSFPEGVLPGVGKTRRIRINKSGEKCTVSSSEDASDLMDLVVASWHRRSQKPPHSLDLLMRLANAAVQKGQGELIYSHSLSEHELLAGGFFAWDSDNYYYIAGGYSPVDHQSIGSTSVIWRGIEDALNGSRNFDFEGSMVPGIAKFFRSFGSEPVEYFALSKNSF